MPIRLAPPSPARLPSGFAMTAGLNVNARHVMPVTLLLPAAAFGFALGWERLAPAVRPVYAIAVLMLATGSTVVHLGQLDEAGPLLINGHALRQRAFAGNVHLGSRRLFAEVVRRFPNAHFAVPVGGAGFTHYGLHEARHAGIDVVALPCSFERMDRTLIIP